MAMASAPVETQVTFTGAGGLEMHGTLTMPANASGHLVPGAVLLPGSGPTDRDGNQPPAIITDILKQISDVLAESGIATLRFDKRATRLYKEKFPKDRADWAEFFKWENFVGDATGAFRFIGAQAHVDPNRIAIVGHSEGSELALQIGSNLARDPHRPAALVTIGGAGRPMGPILHEQIDLRLTQQKMPAQVKKQYMDYLEKALDQVAKDATYPANPPPGFEALFNITTTKLMQAYCTIDPSALAKNYPGPVLVVNGGHDQQVSPERDSPALMTALQQRKTGTAELLIVPQASHNLKSTAEGNEDAMTGPVVPMALEKIKQFLTKALHP
jgi:hypothetical protein